MGRVRRSRAMLRRLAHDPRSTTVLGVLVGIGAGGLAIAASPFWLALAAAAPLAQRWAGGAPASSDLWRAAPGELSDETATEAASDKDWAAVAECRPAAAGGSRPLVESAGLPDGVELEGSIVEY